MEGRSLLTRILVLVMVLCMLLGMYGCRNTQSTQETTTEPSGGNVSEDTTEEDTTEEETEPEEAVYPGSAMSSHLNGKNGDNGIYFTMEPNDLPADPTWATELKPATMSTIVLYRDGQTYNLGNTTTGMLIKFSETEYYLKLEGWIIGDVFPIRNGDVLKIEGVFRSGALNAGVEIPVNYILIEENMAFFSTEYPTGGHFNVVYGGNAEKDPTGMTSNGVYFNLKKNGAYFTTDWSTEYKPSDASAVQIIRDGKTYNVGNIEAGTIVKYGDTNYFLKMEEWIIKDKYPVRDGDIIVLSGKFVHSTSATVLYIDKTYIAIAGGMPYFFTEYPTGNIGPTVIEGGHMSTHSGGLGSTGVHFTLAKNDAPFNEDWSLEYKPVSADVVKLIRGENTYNIGNPDAGSLVKFGETDYYLKTDEWIIGEYFPITDGDILVVEGSFVHAGSETVLKISKTYVAISGGMAYFSEEYPTGDFGPTVIDAGHMTEHADGMGENGFHFTMDKNDAPFNEDWSLEYKPTTTGAVKLIRGENTYDIANLDAGTLVKFGETDYFLKLEKWIIGDYFPITDGDILVVEGSFTNTDAETVIKISKTYVAISGGMAYFSEEYPTGDFGPTIIDAGHMTEHADGMTEKGIYFTLAANDAPFDEWKVEYKPTSAGTIKLIRGENTYDIGNPDAGTLVKFGDSDYYLKMEDWILGDYFPITQGDIIIVEGSFTNADAETVIKISKTYIYVSGGVAYFSVDYPTGDVGPDVIDAGHMTEHADGMTEKGIYFTLAANDAPFNEWDVEYKPLSRSAVKLIRGENTYDIGNPDAGTIVKFGDSDYYLKMEDWIMGDYFPVTQGDIIVVEGAFSNAATETVLNISKTYIYVSGGVPYFSVDYPTGDVGPTVIQGGMMSSHDGGWVTSGNGGLHFTLAENDAPFSDTDWSVRYAPQRADCIKLIRDGQTYDVASIGMETIAKFSDTGYFLEFWPITQRPIVNGDVLVVEGNFVNAANEVVLNISKTYIIFENGEVTFTDTYEAEPEEPETTVPVVDGEYPGGAMSAHDNGWDHDGQNDNDGIYFNMNGSGAPYNSDWSVEYAPYGPGNVRLTRDGQTYDVGMPSGTIVRISETEHFLKTVAWTINGDYLPLQAGDVLTIEGQFVYMQDMTVSLIIPKNTITVNADMTLTFACEDDSQDDGIIQAGSLADHPNGVGSDGVYATMAENAAPDGSYDGDDDAWDHEYTPVTENAYRVIRNGSEQNIGMPGRGTLVKFSSTEYYLKTSGWCLDGFVPTADDIFIIEGQWRSNADATVVMNITKTYLYHNGTTWVFSTTEPGTEPDVEETTEPEVEETTAPEVSDAYQVGVLSAHDAGGSGTGFHANGLENDAPYYDWAAEYAPTSKECIQIIRNGQTIYRENTGAGAIIKLGGTGYYVKFDTWIDSNYPLQAGDLIIIEGDFVGTSNYAEAQGVKLHIDKTYITFDGTSFTFSANEPGTEPETTEPEVEETTEPEVEETTTEPEDSTVHAGVMQTHSAGMFGNGIQFMMAANSAPYNADWSLEYVQTGVDNLKIVRGGVTTGIGIEGRPLLLKLSETDYYLKLDTWSVGDYGLNGTAPVTTDDVLIVEGNFKYGDVTLNITKSYVYYDGAAWVCSATEPGTEPETTEPEVQETTEPEVEETTAPEVSDAYQVGVLSAHDAGGSGTGFHATGLENDAPYYDWAAEYAPTAKECIQIIRNGQTIYRENTGAGAIIKLGGTGYYVKFDTWIDSNYPLQAGDLIIIEGDFVGTSNYAEAQGVKLHIDKTYITYDGESFTFSANEPGTEPETTEPETPETTEPEVEETTAPEADNVYNVGKLASHASGGSATGFHATGAANDAPYDGWSVEYNPVSADCIKLTRGGVTTSVGNTGAGTIVKFGATEYYVKCENWMNGSFPLQVGDEVTVEGKFYNEANDAYIVIEKTTVLYDGESFLIGVIQAGSLSNHDSGAGSDGVHAIMAENAAPFDGWNIEYTPVAEANYRVIRDGAEQNIGIPGRGTLVKFSSTEYYLKTSGWCLDGFTATTDDVLIIEGQWRCNQDATVILNIETTYLYHDGSAWVFSTTAPETTEPETTEPETTEPETTEPEGDEPADDPSVIQAGHLASDNSGLTSTHLFFTMAENEAPYHLTKAVYKPMAASNIQLVRDGVTYDIADPEADTVYKINATRHKIKLASLTMTLQEGDLLIISGLYTGGNTNTGETATFRITTSYITITSGKPTYSETDPRG